MSKTENRNVHMIHADAQLGEVQIADEVVAIIAGLAATEVEGVASMAGNVTNELVAKLGMKKLSKGVKVLVSDQNVVQDKVKAAIENMTGLHVSIVNIRIASVNMEKNK